jgi:hypothetical protein
MKAIFVLATFTCFINLSIAQVSDEEQHPVTEEEIFYGGDQINPEMFPSEEPQEEEFVEQIPVDDTQMQEDPMWEQLLEDNAQDYEE